ncbi:MAG: peptide ABC transporter ATP-binding protein [Catenulispora sp. 13_1_20CM_3_70_7]|nr:MAG: peptide ABC transporter ATP-binding protein [Catenulispora sp. 13_1_20CM_3_70_7]
MPGGSGPDRGAPSRPVVEVRGLRVTFQTPGGPVPAVAGVDFVLETGRCLAIVGESGSGKSVTARTLVGLAGPRAEVRADRLELDGIDLTALTDAQWQRVRGRRAGLVLQDALQSLDPIRRVGSEIAEALRNHRVVERSGLRARAVELLAEVHVPEPEQRARQYPHELSGGLRQRALIASAVAAGPDVLIADEPTTALDVTVQARILDLLAARKADGAALLLISHDLSVVARLADQVAVMFAGVFVEQGTAAELLRSPAHPYTRELLAAVPTLHAKGTRLAVAAPGAESDGLAAPGGCVFAGRCPLVTDRCRQAAPPAVDLGGGHVARCWRTDDPWPEPAARVARDRAGSGGVLSDAPSALAAPAAPAAPVIEVSGIGKSFRRPDRSRRQVVRDVSFTLAAGEALGVVGESGAGKTTVARMVLGLLEPDEGTVRVLGEPWSGRREPERRHLRSRIQLVPQDPLAAFDPRYTVERLVGEALGAPGARAARSRRPRIAELLRLVGLDAALLGRHPRHLSGGQRQRVAIARALAPEPAVLVCDEPVSALDVSVQAQILDLFADLQDRLGVALLFISHDLGVIRHVCDHVLVMRDAAVVESGSVEEVFDEPREAYTKELIAALPLTG